MVHLHVGLVALVPRKRICGQAGGQSGTRAENLVGADFW